VKFLGGGLSVKRTVPEKIDPYVSSDSSLDSDSDGSQPMRLSNNPAAVASRRLRMRKRTRDNEHLPLLQAGDVHLGQHTAGASGIVDASNSAGANAFLLVVALLGANITPGAGGSAGANFTLGTSGSIGTIQATSATYPGTPWDNLRMLEIRSNLGVFASDPPDLET
jgi:hypothetical protein